MSDGDDSSEQEYGGFVFGNDEAADSGEESSLVGDDGSGLTADDEEASLADGLDVRRVAAALSLALAILVLAIVVVQPLVTGMATNLFGTDSPSGPGNATTASTTVETNAPGGTNDPDETADPVGTTVAATRDRRTTTGTTTATPTLSPTSVVPTATATAVSTTAPDATRTTATAGNATTAPSGRSPAIESFTVTDRSAGGNATFGVAWNVTDPDVDLASIRVTVVADPDGESRTVAQRRFDAGGASTVGDGTFEIEGGSGTVYEIRMEVTDAAGNSVFALRREVADGEPDG